MENDIYEMMSTLRAVRRLRPDPIPGDVLERVLQAACWAPTGGNMQPWRVVVVRDPVVKAGLAGIYAPQWAAYSEGFMDLVAGLPEAELAKWKRVLAAGDHLAANLGSAPAILMFCGNPSMMAITDVDQGHIPLVGGGSVYPAVQNAMLAARTEGLGCCLTTLHCQREPEVAELLGVPDGWGIPAMVPLGYPIGGGHGPITRKPPRKLAYADRFGEAWS